MIVFREFVRDNLVDHAPRLCRILFGDDKPLVIKHQFNRAGLCRIVIACSRVENQRTAHSVFWRRLVVAPCVRASQKTVLADEHRNVELQSKPHGAHVGRTEPIAP